MGGRRERKECELEDIPVLLSNPNSRDVRRKTQTFKGELQQVAKNRDLIYIDLPGAICLVF